MKGEKNVIKFVRHYQAYREDWFDVVYESGRCYTYRLPDLPKTVDDFIQSAESCEEQYDRTFKRKEYIYTRKAG